MSDFVSAAKYYCIARLIYGMLIKNCPESEEKNMHTLNKRVLSNLIKQIIPYISVKAYDLSDWKIKYGRYDGDGKYTYNGSESDFHVGDRWTAGYDDSVLFTCDAEIPELPDGNRLCLNMNFGGETVVRFDGKIVCSVSSKLHNGWVARENVPIPHEYAGKRVHIEAESGICCAGFCDDAMAGAKTTNYDAVSAGILLINIQAEKYYFRVRELFDSLQYIDDSAIAGSLYRIIDDSVHMLDFDFTRERFLNSVAHAREYLENKISALPAYHPGKVYMCGHSHIDVAWLWTVKESERKAVRTFANTLDLMDENPDFIFAQSQAVLYDMVKKNAPDVFNRIKEKVKSGQWEIMGNAWVEADTNIASGESLIRQLLYGRDFFMREFGIDSDIYWLPDCFGFSWALPQIIKRSGMRRFITTKLINNDTNAFPRSMFRWRGNSGDEVTAFFQQTHYQGEFDAEYIKGCRETNLQKDIADISFGMYGYGDGGSGCTTDMLERAEALRNIPGMPAPVLAHTYDFFDDMEQYRDELPVWDGEMYYENHRGTYTSQAFVKKNNRQGEFMLRNAEIISSLAEIYGAGEYPVHKLYELWKLLLVNQFHDILPGTSIHETYENTRLEYARLKSEGKQLISDTLRAVTDGKSDGFITVLNPLTHPVSGTVSVALPDGYSAVEDLSGNKAVCAVYDNNGVRSISFTASDVPSLGYKIYKFTAEAESRPTVTVSPSLLENDYLKIKFDNNGEITSVYDKENCREVLTGNANALTIYQDKPIHESAWNLEFDYQMKSFPLTRADSITVTEASALRCEIKIVRSFNKSTITQYISLAHNERQIRIRTEAEWYEREKILKADFPVAVRSPYSTCETAHGSIQRPTHYNTSYDQAKFEICMHKWVDLSEGDYGVSILNDCKYGCNVTDGKIGITLLRGPIVPDPTADIGHHEFTYVFVPHSGSWQQADISALSYELNMPLAAVPGIPMDFCPQSFINIDRRGIVLDAFKKSLDNDGYILRIFEAHTTRGSCTVRFAKAVTRVRECNMMEVNEAELSHSDSSFTFSIKPNEVKTFRINF